MPFTRRNGIPQQATAGDIPQLDETIRAVPQERTAVGRKRDTAHRKSWIFPCVARDWQPDAQQAPLAVGQVPKGNDSVEVAARQQSTVWRKGDAYVVPG